MQKLTSMLKLGFVLIILIIFGCSNIPDNIAVSTDGVEISFTDTGHGEPTLIFVHGWGADRSGWEGQVSHFSEKHRVVRLDLAGFGESGNNRQDWTMEMYGEDVASVLKRLKIKQAVLVGHSMGAYTVLEAARIVPERVIGLVPVDMLQNVEETYTPELIEERIGRFQAFVQSPDVTVSTIGWMECIKEAMVYRGHLVDALRDIRAPICCINSDSQPTKVEIARKYAKSFDARIIKGVGHGVMRDAPEEFNRLLAEIVEEFVRQAKSD